MKLQSEGKSSGCQTDASGELSLTIAIREIQEDGDKYFVANCLEIPGCISQGDTQEEAEKNINDAINACLSVIMEDAFKSFISRQDAPDLRGITSQRRLNITSLPKLQYEYA